MNILNDLDNVLSNLTIYHVEIEFILEENSSSEDAIIITIHQESIISRHKAIENTKSIISKLTNKFNIEFDVDKPIDITRKKVDIRQSEWVTKTKLIGKKENIELLKNWWADNHEKMSGIEIIEKPKQQEITLPSQELKESDPMIQTIHATINPGNIRDRIIETWKTYDKLNRQNINFIKRFISTNIDTLNLKNFKKPEYKKEFKSKLNSELITTEA